MLVACGDSSSATTTDLTGASTSTSASATSGTATSGDLPTTTGTSSTPGTTRGETSTAGEASTGEQVVSTSEPGTTTTTTTTTDSDTSTGTTATGGDGQLKISLTDIDIYADCGPMTADDPIVAEWTVVYDNSDAPTTSAALSFVGFYLDGDPPTGGDWVATPTTSGEIGAGEVLEQVVTKVSGYDFLPFCDLCGSKVDLHLGFVVAGEQVFVSHSEQLECVQ